jgi:hypothetical protein
MKEIVVVPTFNRPELLALCLEKIEQAADAPDDIRIYLDASMENRVSEVEYVRDMCLPRALIFHAKSHLKVASGCWNILTAIKSGYETGADFCWLIEEDVLIYPARFFSWHRKQVAAASCGRRHWDHRWKHRDLYTNPGSLLRRPLLDALVPHINDEYFTDTTAYCEKHFPYWDVSTLDDWLIRRVMKQEGMTCVYPEKAVCAHVGFRGYGQLDIYQNNDPDLEKRIERARYLLATVKNTDMYARDFEASE